MYFSLTDPATAKQKKRRYLTEISLHEVFLEAVPATLVLVVLLTIALGCIQRMQNGIIYKMDF